MKIGVTPVQSPAKTADPAPSPAQNIELSEEEKQLKKEKRSSLIKALIKDKMTDPIPYFTKEEDLKEWPYLKSLLSSDPARQKMAIEYLEAHPEQVSPMVLLLATEYFLTQNKKEKAALYLYASQLRVRFDMERWPIVNESGISARKKTHPATETLLLSTTIAQGIYGWSLAQKPRFLKIMETLKEWDKATPYAYRPFYEIPSSTEIETWTETLGQTRTDFFEKQIEMISAIHPE